MTRLQKTVLAIAGLIALGIGGFIFAAPQYFYAGYGIPISNDPSMLSELRAPGAGLTVLGALMLAGIVRPSWAQLSVAVAFTVFLAFPLGRLVSLAADGMPSGGIIAALAIEVAVGAMCLVAFRPKGPGEAQAG